MTDLAIPALTAMAGVRPAADAERHDAAGGDAFRDALALALAGAPAVSRASGEGAAEHAVDRSDPQAEGEAQSSTSGSGPKGQQVGIAIALALLAPPPTPIPSVLPAGAAGSTGSVPQVSGQAAGARVAPAPALGDGAGHAAPPALAELDLVPPADAGVADATSDTTDTAAMRDMGPTAGIAGQAGQAGHAGHAAQAVGEQAPVVAATPIPPTVGGGAATAETPAAAAGDEVRAAALDAATPQAPDAIGSQATSSMVGAPTAGQGPGLQSAAGTPAEALSADLAARIEAAASALEHAPPPRRVVLELSDLGNLQLAVSLRGGEVHVQVMGGERTLAGAPTWRSDLAQALSERGLSLGSAPDGEPRGGQARDAGAQAGGARDGAGREPADGPWPDSAGQAPGPSRARRSPRSADNAPVGQLL